MKRLMLLVGLVAITTGCAELHERALGTRVQRLNVKGVEYIHCSIVMNKAKPQQAHDALEVCRDEIQGTPTMPHGEARMP